MPDALRPGSENSSDNGTGTDNGADNNNVPDLDCGEPLSRSPGRPGLETATGFEPV